MSQLDEAIVFATRAHEKQVDKGGQPYILHPLSVMLSVFPDEDAMVVAVLHDVIEDTPFALEEVTKLLDLDEEQSKALGLLSREPAGTPDRPTYREHIARLAPNNLARTVKMADLRHNMNPVRMAGLAPEEKGLIHRYELAMEDLMRYEE